MSGNFEIGQGNLKKKQKSPLTTSVYPVCCTAITRSWHYTGYSASVMSEINKSRSEPGNAPQIGIRHREEVCQK